MRTLELLVCMLVTVTVCMTLLPSQSMGDAVATPAATDLGPCDCDVTGFVCDLGCCCDSDCSATALDYFNASGIACTAGSTLNAADSRLCVNRDKVRASNGLDATWFGDALCVTVDNYPSDGYFYPVPPAPLAASAAAAALNSAPTAAYLDPDAIAMSSSRTRYPPGASLLLAHASSTALAAASPFLLPRPVGASAKCSTESSLMYRTDAASASCVRSVDPAVSGACAAASLQSWAASSVLPTPTTGATQLPLTVGSVVCYDSTDRASRVVVTCPASPEVGALDAVAGTCTNTLTDLSVTVGYTADNVVASVVLDAGVAVSAGPGSSASFDVSVVSQASFVPSDGPAPTPTSGNPGYVRGLPVRGGNLADDTATTVTSVDLDVAAGNANGECVAPGALATDASRPTVAYGHDTLHVCTLAVTAADITDCAALQSTILSVLSPTASVNVVASWGSSAADAPSDWAALSVPATAPTPVQGTGICSNLVVGVAYGFLSVSAGAATNPQEKIIGAQMEYIIGSAVAPQSGSATASLLLSTSATFVQADSPSPDEVFPRNPNLIPELPSDVWYPFKLGSSASTSAPLSLSLLALLAAAIAAVAAVH